jgi:predicted ArsR family transcriptional regulator
VKEVLKISDLQQVRLLSDPLKLRLLQAFAENAGTTKEVAAELGESVTKLYRHVDALHDAGLLEIVSERQKRGAIERTFRAVAKRFEADHTLFGEESGEEGTRAAREILRSAETEILGAIAKMNGERDRDAMLMRFRLKASPERVEALHRSLVEWCESVQADENGQEENAEDTEEYGALIAFYPLD